MGSRLTLAQEFPRTGTGTICTEAVNARWPSDLRNSELALQWFYREESHEIRLCPPRADIDIRRDIRKERIRLRGLRSRFSAGVSSSEPTSEHLAARAGASAVIREPVTGSLSELQHPTEGSGRKSPASSEPTSGGE